jgi:hypothetical protein
MNGVLEVRGDANEGSVVNREKVISLHDVDTLVTQTATNIGDGRVTAIAQDLLNYDPEAQVWQDSPSLALMVSSIVKWCFYIVLWLGALSYLAVPPSLPPSTTPADAAQTAPAAPVPEKQAHGKKKSRAAAKAASVAEEPKAPAGKATSAGRDDIWYQLAKWVGILVIAYQVYAHGVWALRLKNIRYKMSSQRLMVESGIFSKTTNTYEIHQLNASGQIHRPFFLRLFGRANLWVGVWLSGIRHPEAVRDLVRNAGQIEASRVEKARWR